MSADNGIYIFNFRDKEYGVAHLVSFYPENYDNELEMENHVYSKCRFFSNSHSQIVKEADKLFDEIGFVEHGILEMTIK